jgi:hypothetical protein
MHEQVIHKLIMPVPKEGFLLNDLILCWREVRSPLPEQILGTKFSTNINQVDCPVCWDIWRRGEYNPFLKEE